MDQSQIEMSLLLGLAALAFLAGGGFFGLDELFKDDDDDDDTSTSTTESDSSVTQEEAAAVLRLAQSPSDAVRLFETGRTEATGNEPQELTATSGDDALGVRFETGLGRDTITGSASGDIALSSGGHDVIIGQEGDDLLLAGSGNDTLLGDAGEDTLFGENGDDRLRGGEGGDILFGGAGNDNLDDTSLDVTDTLFGGSGDDILTGHPDDVLVGGDGSDRFIFFASEFSADTTMARIYDFTPGTDRVEIILEPGQTNAVLGTRVPSGINFNSVILTMDGVDIIEFPGSSTFDTSAVELVTVGVDNTLTVQNLVDDPSLAVFEFGTTESFAGSSGDDLLEMQNDTFPGVGQGGFFDGRGGNDTIDASQASDLIYGGDGDDVIGAGLSNDLIFGGAGDDSIQAGWANDVAFGEEGNDTIEGLFGRDTLFGGAGNDVLTDLQSNAIGSNDVDTLFGGAGDDTIHLGRLDQGHGGAGADRFVLETRRFEAVDDEAVIHDFTASEDVIVINRNSDTTSPITTTRSADGTEITILHGTQVVARLINLNPSSGNPVIEDPGAPASGS